MDPLVRDKLIAITHGDPTKEEDCGRPLYQRPPVNDDRLKIPVYVCPVHGDVHEPKQIRSWFHADARKRQVSEL